jgi:hypothetical protein
MTKRSGLVAIVMIVLTPFSLALWAGQDAQVPAPQRETQADSGVMVPSGTIISIALSAYLNTRSTQVGDPFYADVVYPVWVQQRLIIPKGSTIKGTVTEVVRPGRIKGKGRLALRIDDILLPNGVQRDLVAVFHGIHGSGDEKIDRKSETVEAGASKGEDAGQIVGPASQGALIGAISGRGTGAGIGAGAGAAVGLATVLFTRGRDLVLVPGTQFDLELKQPMKFAWSEIDFTKGELDNARRISNPARYPQQQPNQNQPRRRSWPIPWLGTD